MTTFYHKYSNLKIADIKNKYFYNILQLKGLYLNILVSLGENLLFIKIFEPPG